MSDTIRAFTAESTDQGHRRGVVDFPVDDLPTDDCLSSGLGVTMYGHAFATGPVGTTVLGGDFCGHLDLGQAHIESSGVDSFLLTFGP